MKVDSSPTDVGPNSLTVSLYSLLSFNSDLLFSYRFKFPFNSAFRIFLHIKMSKYRERMEVNGSEGLHKNQVVFMEI